MTSTAKTLLVLGGTSDIGRATALAFADAGWAVQLAGRNPEALQREADDISARTGAPVTVHLFDLLDTGSFPAFVAGLPAAPDALVTVAGLLGDQARAENDLSHAAEIMRSNFEGPALITGLFAEKFLERGSGVIAGVSSVAGERGRASNYVYGSAKAGFTAFLSGLRNRAAKRGVHVVTVKPGFVRTKMTEGMKLPGPLTVEPRAVGDAIFAAVEKGRDVIYVGGAWRGIMTVIRFLPEFIFKKMSI